MDTETLTRRFEVPLTALLESGGVDWLNDLLDAELEDEPHIATGISYRVAGCIAGTDTDEGSVLIEATYTPDLYDEDDAPFIYGDRVIWTDPDGGNQRPGTVRSDLDHDGQYWVQFDGADPNVQTEVYAHELRLSYEERFTVP